VRGPGGWFFEALSVKTARSAFTLDGRINTRERRFAFCGAARDHARMSGLRAEAFDYGAQELIDLEYYLMWRARGMKVETPAVRP